MGTFIAPKPGLYVFTWSIRCLGNNHHTTELLVDNNIVNVIYISPGNVMDGTVTGIAVIQVNRGDDVFIRTGLNSNGIISSDEYGRSSFAGWILMWKKNNSNIELLFYISVTMLTISKYFCSFVIHNYKVIYSLTLGLSTGIRNMLLVIYLLQSKVSPIKHY